MKQIILGLLFVIGMIGNLMAQERAVQKKVQDMVGTFSNSEIQQLETAIQEVKSRKGWDVFLITGTTSSPQVFLNVPLASAVGTKKILITIPKEYKALLPKISISTDLQQALLISKIRLIEKDIMKPLVYKKNYFLAAFNAINSLLLDMSSIDFYSNLPGFDDNSIPYYPDYNKVVKIGDEAKRVVFKTILPSNPTSLGVKITGDILPEKVFMDFDGSKFITPPPLNLHTIDEDLNLTINLKYNTPEEADYITIKTRVESKTGDVKSECNLISFTPKRIRLGVYVVNEYSDDIQIIKVNENGLNKETACISWGGNKRLETIPLSGIVDTPTPPDDQIGFEDGVPQRILVGKNTKCDTKAKQSILINRDKIINVSELQVYLNEIYSQINVEWTVSIVPRSIDIDYDKDNNNNMDIRTFDECDIIEEALQKESEFSNFDKILVILNTIDYPLTPGITMRNGEEFTYQAQFVHTAGKTLTESSKPYLTIAHELGHTLGLDDLTSQFKDIVVEKTKKVFVEDDKNNVMTYSLSRIDKCCKSFRKFQWDTMRKHMKDKYNK
jgi:hypothetical protein